MGLTLQWGGNGNALQLVSTLSVRQPLRYHARMNAIPFLPFVIGVAGGSGSGKSTVT
jgi:uridine kinase